MAADCIDILNDILKHNGLDDVDLRNNEVDRYFLFDQISDPDDLDRAWALFPAHEEIRSRSARVDAVSDIVPGFGYRTPKKSNRCSDAELIDCARRHFAAIQPLILRQDYNREVLGFLNAPYDVVVVHEPTTVSPKATENSLFGTLYEAIGEFMLEHYAFETPIKVILNDWATCLTTCNEVALYLLWPVLDDVSDIDADTGIPGFDLWRYGCRTSYWIKDNDPKSGLVYVRPPWHFESAT
jgi:hypothetical protein